MRKKKSEPFNKKVNELVGKLLSKKEIYGILTLVFLLGKEKIVSEHSNSYRKARISNIMC